MSLTKEIAKLPKEKRERAMVLLREKRKLELKNSYYEFFKEAWKIIEPSIPLKDSPHIKFLCKVLEVQAKRLFDGFMPEYDIIIINVPPGSSKSSIVTKIFPAWLWANDPSIRLITSSYKLELSTDHTVKSRDIIVSKWYQSYFGNTFKLKGDQNTKTRYSNDKTGIRLATSTGGGTGFHCHIWIDDDPLNVKKAASEAHRKDAKDHSNKTVPSRVIENGFRIMVMQRLHEEDPTGNELDKLEQATKEGREPDKKVLHICLPVDLSQGNVKPPELAALYEDGHLIPDRMNEAFLKPRRVDLGSFEYSGQYMQDPVPAGGGKIKREWFQYCRPDEVPKGIVWDFWIDGAYTQKKANDPTGIMVCGFHKYTKILYVKHFTGKWLEMPELLAMLDKYTMLHGHTSRSRTLIEPKATGLTLAQLIRKDHKHMSPIKIKGHLVSEGKEARIQVASPKYEAGKVFHIRGGWNEEFEKQLCGFPVVKHDEAVDLIGYATYRYFDKRGRRGIKKS
jgi:predicted phage terminase large subunit-like protein